jgi:DNA helicase-2/ATP-dependent DNA helicase PcrA
VWRFEDATDQLDLEDSYETYLDSARTRYDTGERRLAYVALTRSAKDMLLSGSWWASGKNRRSPSVYLAEIIEAGLAASPPPEEPVETENPWDPRAASVVWPLPPLGAREPRVRAAAALVRSVTGTQRATLPGEMSQLESDSNMMNRDFSKLDRKKLQYEDIIKVKWKTIQYVVDNKKPQMDMLTRNMRELINEVK